MFACTRMRVRLQVQLIVGSVVVWSWACVRAQPIYRNKAIRSGGSGGDARTSDVRSCSAATRARRVAVGANRRRTAGGAQAPCFHSHVTDSTWRNPAASLANAVTQPRVRAMPPQRCTSLVTALSSAANPAEKMHMLPGQCRACRSPTSRRVNAVRSFVVIRRCMTSADAQQLIHRSEKRWATPRGDMALRARYPSFRVESHYGRVLADCRLACSNVCGVRRPDQNQRGAAARTHGRGSNKSLRMSRMSSSHTASETALATCLTPTRRPPPRPHPNAQRSPATEQALQRKCAGPPGQSGATERTAPTGCADGLRRRAALR